MSLSKALPLGAVLRQTTSASEPEVKLALGRLAAEIKDRLQRPPSPSSEAFFSSAVRALSRIRGAANSESRMGCLFDCACFFYINDFAAEALDSVRQLDEMATRSKSKPWIRKSETVGGVVHAELGNVAEGIVRLSNALKISRESNILYGELAALNNLGSVLNYGGLYRESIQCLERAVTLTDVNAKNPLIAELDLRSTALTNLAQSHYYLENFDTGFHAIALCLANAREPHNAVSAVARSIREFTYVQLALQLKKFDSAREHVALCRKYAASGGARAHVVAQIAEGLCEVHCGNVESGLRLLQSSVDGSGRVTSLRNSALLALVRALEEVDQPERALVLVQDLLKKMRSLREEGVNVLLSNHTFLSSSPSVTAERDDLRAITFAEANLRARVALHEVANARIETLERLALTADLKEDSTGDHGFRVGRLAFLIAKEMGWPKSACSAIDLAARLHDIGKIGMPDSILLKSSPLIASERHFLDAHASIGANLLSNSDVPHLRLAEEIARFHHEWWDGRGYPSRLSGKRIPIHARIVAVADVFDALTHGRPYAQPWPLFEALNEIRARRGNQFDPDVVNYFVAAVERLGTDLEGALAAGAEPSALVKARQSIRTLIETETASVHREQIGEETSLP